MVFDNCQIDVFFHMRNHYNRLRNVQSVVDCSPPKGLKRSTHTDTSFHYVGMAHQPNHGNEMKKHHCVYGNYTGIIRPRSTTGRSPRSKSVPPRPGTRRHPEDMPCTQEIYSKSSKLTYLKSARWMLDDKNTRFQSDGNSIQCSPQNSRKCDANACSKITNPTVCTLYGASTKSCPSTGRSVRLNTSNLTEKSTFSYQVPECSDFDESTRYNTPMSTPSCTDGNISPQDHEYLQFLLRITEDIIKNDLYTNKEMKKVFMSHIDANKDRLSLDRMLLRVHELMKELNMPLSDDTEEDSTPSWTEIETAMKGLLCLEKIKPKEKPVTPKSIRSKYKSTPDPEKKCICFDLRSLDINTANKSKMTEKEIESLNYEDLDSINKFKSSLDRLTECTEPISSRATCKVSAPTSCSTFGNIEVLPGFECLETPKASRGIAKEDIYQPRTPVKFTTEIGCSCAKRKKKSTKRRRKIKSSKFKNSRVISKRLKPNRRPKKVIEIKAEIENNESQDVRSEVPMCKKNTDKTVSKPLIISLDADNQTDGNNTYFRNSKNDYIFVKGPIYLLKAFLKENPNIVMRIEVPGDTFASTSVPILQKPGDYSHDPVRKPEDGSNSKKKENSKDKTMIDLLGDNYTTSISNGPIQLENFLTTREIQTEDIRVDPIIVATVLVQKDESDEDVSASIDDISNGSHHDLPKVRNIKSDSKEFLSEEEMNTSLNVSGDDIMSHSQIDDSQPLVQVNIEAFLEKISKPADRKNLNEVTVVVSTQTTNGTLTSTATVEKTNQILLGEVEEDFGMKAMSPLFKSPKSRSDQRDSIDEGSELKELNHQRRVSILKNPVIQIPIEKMFSDSEDSKKKSDSIKKAVDTVKDRQSNKDTFLARTIQDIENNRESRISDKANDSDVSDRSSDKPQIPHSLLRDTVRGPRPSYFPNVEGLNIADVSSVEDIYGIDSNPSYNELPIKMSTIKPKDSRTTTESDSSTTVLSSEPGSQQMFNTQLDEHLEMNISPSQMKQINLITAKLEQFRHANEKSEGDISATLDKLVDAFKEQQEMEDEIQIKDEDRSDLQSTTSSHKHSFHCCGFGKKKKAPRKASIHEMPQQTPFSEEIFRAKSEAFEIALSDLGHKALPKDNRKHSKLKETHIVTTNKPQEDKDRIFSTNTSHASAIVHNGNRLSLVRIAEERDVDLKIDFDAISAVASRNDNINDEPSKG